MRKPITVKIKYQGVKFVDSWETNPLANESGMSEKRMTTSGLSNVSNPKIRIMIEEITNTPNPVV